MIICLFIKIFAFFQKRLFIISGANFERLCPSRGGRELAREEEEEEEEEIEELAGVVVEGGRHTRVLSVLALARSLAVRL